MDQRERADSDEEALRAALDGRQAAIWTALPGIIESFDVDAQTVSIQPATQIPYRGPDGAVTMLTMPLLLDCPVQFPAGGRVSLTFPVTKGDECLVVFASRCIDSWWQSGGVQPPAEHRMHDLSDGHALLGVRSKPRALANVSTSAVELRSDDHNAIISLNPTTHAVTITAPGGATVNADTTINGTLHVTGDITCDATVTGATDVVGGGKSLKTHIHTDPQGGNTGAPV
jgi:hypothetical protein